MGDGEFLDEEILREFSDGEVDEEGGGYLGEVVVGEVEGSWEIYDVCVVDEDFVKELEEIVG